VLYTTNKQLTGSHSVNWDLIFTVTPFWVIAGKKWDILTKPASKPSDGTGPYYYSKHQR